MGREVIASLPFSLCGGGTLMREPVAWWKWVIIVIGLLIIVVGAGRWIYQRFVAHKAPPPPATPEEAAKEYEQYLGYPVKPPPSRR